MLDNESIGEAIRIFREAKQMTAQALSFTIGEPSYYVSRLESGKLKLDFLRAMRIAPVLGIKEIDIANAALAIASRKKLKY